MDKSVTTVEPDARGGSNDAFDIYKLALEDPHAVAVLATMRGLPEPVTLERIVADCWFEEAEVHRCLSRLCTDSLIYWDYLVIRPGFRRHRDLQS